MPRFCVSGVSSREVGLRWAARQLTVRGLSIPDKRTTAALENDLHRRIEALCDAGWEMFDRFDHEVRQKNFHAFVAADYPVVLATLVKLPAPGRRFLEWGSATGVIAIMADLLGFEAYGIEIDGRLVEQARELAVRHGSGARFTTGSFLPTGYRWKPPGGDRRLGTISSGESGYLQMGMPLEDFDVVFGYPWPGEEALMLDLMRVHGGADATLLIHTPDGMRVYRGGVIQNVSAETFPRGRYTDV